MECFSVYEGIESDSSSFSGDPANNGADGAAMSNADGDGNTSGTSLLFKKEHSGAFRSSTQYLCTSDSGVAHVLDMDVVACSTWFEDSPYTWGVPKSTDNTIVHIGGSRVPYSVRKRSCHLPNVCSLMPESVADLAHEEVNFEHPTWVSAMNLCEDNDSPERRVHQTTLAFYKTVQKIGEGGCSFKDNEGCPCGGAPVFDSGRGSRGAFIGFSGWRSADPLKRDGGHMSTAVPHGVDEEKLSKWLESGVEEEEPGESCCFISSKRVKDRSCMRHGGLLPRLRRAAGGQCPSAIADAGEGVQTSCAFMRKLRHDARFAAHPFGQDLLGVMDLLCRSDYKHP
ncbi:hypothetical protein I4F81_001339 [Pyropia yezoensis]|uniref:Uncharacterized protein n=1 Tax=Pyropia yezoensis TaxID=2788 RepID=A0ACC3BMC5_PYRYE|nr:hypothetical protein I4F81_001339 [Neopyropia yezoensis]